MTAFENKEIKEIMEELENCEKRKHVDEHAYQNNSRQHYPEWSNLFKQSDQCLPNMLNLPNEKLASLANLENLAEAMREGWKSQKSNPKEIQEQESFVIFKTTLDRVNN